MNRKQITIRSEFNDDLSKRHRIGKFWYLTFLTATVIGTLILSILIFNILDGAMGYVVLDALVDPETLTSNGVLLENQSKEILISILREHLSQGAVKKLDEEKPLEERSQNDIYNLVIERVVKYKVVTSWSLWESLTQSEAIKDQTADEYPDAELKFVSWLTIDTIRKPQSSEAVNAGIRTAILGSLLTTSISILVAFPLGVGAAIYLEEYAVDNWLNRIIRMNINNLAGVPSIIYGILGLAIFVRAMEKITSGSLFGVVNSTSANGRTILSAGLTLSLLILPLIIINGQEAIRAVPQSLRRASLGIGATKWQTVWSHVLPNALPGILTGTILAISRSIGETAPLIVVGASTAISFDPGLFSRFTILPIQIYQWTARPQAEWRHLAAAAILVLMVLLLSLNASAIVLRNRFTKRF